MKETEIFHTTIGPQILPFSIILEYRGFISYHDKSFHEAIYYSESLFITFETFILDSF